MSPPASFSSKTYWGSKDRNRDTVDETIRDIDAEEDLLDGQDTLSEVDTLIKVTVHLKLEVPRVVPHSRVYSPSLYPPLKDLLQCKLELKLITHPDENLYKILMLLILSFCVQTFV